jgi:hypothetical protein
MGIRGGNNETWAEWDACGIGTSTPLPHNLRAEQMGCAECALHHHSLQVRRPKPEQEATFGAGHADKENWDIIITEETQGAPM